MDLLSKLSVEEVLNYLPDPVVIIDSLGNISFANLSFLNLLGYEPFELINHNIINFLLDDSVFEECMLEIQNSETFSDQATVFIAKDGRHIYTTKSVKSIRLDDRSCIFVNIRDISKIDRLNTQLYSSNMELEEQSKHLENLLHVHKKHIDAQQLQLDEIVNGVDEIIWYIDDKSMEIKYVSNAIEKIFGGKKESYINNSSLWMQMVHPEDQARVIDFFRTIKSSHSQTIEFRITTHDGTLKWLSNTISHHSFLNFFIGVTRDITHDKEIQVQMEFMAFHDMLTKLPNRSFLKNEINSYLKKATIIAQQFAVLFLDLDNFKYINDSMGHEIGDEILIFVANKLNEIIGKDGVCTRFGGDEFVVLMNIQNEKDVSIKAQKIINTLNEPFIMQEHEFFLTSSIGISIYPDDASTATELIKSADTAMYEAKRSGKNRYTFFSPSMNTHVQEFMQLESIIKDALVNNYFELYFQPLIDSASSTLYGFEALLRLIHPQLGFISPEKFIPVAEATGDILKISSFVMQRACHFSSQINALSNTKIHISINISARQFKEKFFAQEFLKCAADYGADPKLLTVEMTESVVMDNLLLTINELTILRQAGVKIALDDFGTGYSSFEYLAQLPINTIKIDKSFIIPVFENRINEHIVLAIASLASALDLNIVAEGVETYKHVEYLKQNKIELLQGFYYSKAISGAEILSNIGEYKKLFNL
jgi:diguanylate cyclase (GGDEF)-like protein/PAS domain S-box-containing protein